MPTEEQLREIHCLAVLGEATEIAQDMGGWLSGHWLEVSRFREVRHPPPSGWLDESCRLKGGAVPLT